MKYCPECGYYLGENAARCPQCGAEFSLPQQVRTTAQAEAGAPLASIPVENAFRPVHAYIQQPVVQLGFDFEPETSPKAKRAPAKPRIDPSWPVRSKTTAALLSFFLGDFGIQFFYLGNTTAGLMCLLFFWTGIPAFIGFVLTFVYLSADDEKWQIDHHVRIS